MQRPREWIEYESKVFQRHHSKQGRVARLPEDGGAVSFADGERDVTFRDVAFDASSVAERKTGTAFR
jgi:hypothetical protein